MNIRKNVFRLKSVEKYENQKKKNLFKKGRENGFDNNYCFVGIANSI